MRKYSGAPYLNPDLSLEVRVNDLLSRMTPQQKLAQLGCVGGVDGKVDTSALSNGIGQVTGTFSPGERVEEWAEYVDNIQKILVDETELGIPAIVHIEGMAGGVFSGATSFPVAIAVAAACDPEKTQKMGDIVRRQMRTVGFHQTLCPVLDVARDLRWGRLGETYGENPTLIAMMGVAYVNGLQGKDLRKGIAATAKHFLGYAMSEGGLNSAEQHLSEREVREIYAKTFAAAIDKAGVLSVMNSYGSMNGEPIITSQRLLSGLLREELGFKGVVTSDYSSIDRAVSPMNTQSDITSAGIAALKAGVDMELPVVAAYGPGILEAVAEGRLYQSIIDRSVRRVLELKFKLGLFENPYSDKDGIKKEFSNSEYEKLSYVLARESIVLTKNQNNTLPLSKNIPKIAVIGPNANQLRCFFAGYTYPAMMEWRQEMAAMAKTANKDGMPAEGQASPGSKLDIETVIRQNYHTAVTILEAVKTRVPQTEVVFARGCGIKDTDTSGFAEAVMAARSADVAILVVGGKSGWGEDCTIGEGVDSAHIGLPGVQEELVRAVHETGTPIVIVHMDARPLSSLWISENIPSLLEVWYSGQCGAKAIVDTIFGDANPGGKLPFTCPKSSGQMPNYFGHKKGSGYAGLQSPGSTRHGYADLTYCPIFYFGHGLSYTRFAYSGLEVSSDRVSTSGSLTVSCVVENIGSVAGDEVVQFYFIDKLASMVRPVQELAGIKRVHLNPGEKKKVTFTINMSQLAFLNGDMQWIVEPGEVQLMLGSSSVDIRLQKSVFLTGNILYLDSHREYYASADVENVIR